jgi:hypothetical protein
LVFGIVGAVLGVYFYSAADGTDPEFDDDSLVVLGKYAVVGNEVDDDIPDEYRAVWDRFAELFPAESHPDLTMFVAIDGTASGADGALAPSSALPQDERYIALDVTGSDTPEELDGAMIHEFGHLVTMRESQVPTDEVAAESCPVYAYYGCPATRCRSGPCRFLAASGFQAAVVDPNVLTPSRVLTIRASEVTRWGGRRRLVRSGLMAALRADRWIDRC